MSKYVAVWLDHKEARIFSLNADGADEAKVLAPLHNVHHKHPRGQDGGKEHPNDAKQFFADVCRNLTTAEEILVVGPGSAKLELIRYLHQHEKGLEPKVVAVETVDHPTDGQIIAYAKTAFKRIDRMASV